MCGMDCKFKMRERGEETLVMTTIMMTNMVMTIMVMKMMVAVMKMAILSMPAFRFIIASSA